MKFARSIRFALGFAAVGGGSLLFVGTALADTASATPISVVSTDANVSINSSTTSSQVIHQTSQISGTTAINDAVGTSTSPTESPATSPSSEPAAIVKSDSGSTLVSNDASTSATTNALSSQAVSTVAEASKSVGASLPIVAIHALTSAYAPTTYMLLTTSFGIGNTNYAPAPQTLVISSGQPQAPAPVAPKAPIAPFGAVGAILSLFANAIPVRLLDLDVASLGFAFLSALLIVMAIRLNANGTTFVFNFGSWLRQSGYLAVTAAGLPTGDSRFSTSMVLDYVSAPAPYA